MYPVHPMSLSQTDGKIKKVEPPILDPILLRCSLQTPVGGSTFWIRPGVWDRTATSAGACCKTGSANDKPTQTEKKTGPSAEAPDFDDVNPARPSFDSNYTCCTAPFPGVLVYDEAMQNLYH